ncbi:MAG: hypothetical protein K0R50_3754 [Eubacterium sp.]|jgi:uncharacterized SAM-binding protein YcdF (DUF218 family)|nr:hypothetical protein [Eubacterium sp.]
MKKAQLSNMKYINDITDFIFLENEPQKTDIIFIPGGSFPETAEHAAKLWNEGFAKYILPSGKFSVKRGYFPGALSKENIYTRKYTTEWEFLKDVLVVNGVDEKSVLKEDNATNTFENAIYSRKVTDSLDMNIQKAIVCCKAFHARRCLMYYQTLYPATHFMICPVETQMVSRQNWYMSENGINKVMGELARCGNQFIDILKNMVAERE